MPFFVSGGADSIIRIFEHNPYMAYQEDGNKNEDKSDGELAKPPVQAKGDDKADGKSWYVDEETHLYIEFE